jgi:hypothetical protein
MTKQVQIVTADGKVIGAVSQQATSVGASKVAKAPVQFARVDGRYVWRVKAA